MIGLVPPLMASVVPIHRILSPNGLLLLLALLAAIVWLGYRKGWIFASARVRPAGACLPSPAPRPAWTARLVETAVLAVAGFVVFVVAAATSYTGGHLLNLHDLPPEYANVQVVAFVCAAFGMFIAFLAAITGRTAAGTILMGVVLAAYGMVLNLPHRPGEWFVPTIHRQPEVECAFNVSANVQGAELWLNGVRLCTMPCTITMSDLAKRVPHWTKPPKGFDTAEVKTHVYHVLSGEGYSSAKQWWRLELPPFLPSAPSYGPDIRDGEKPAKETYYAQVRYAGEWAGLSGGGGSAFSRPNGIYHCDVTLSTQFPQREKRLDNLLKLAQLAGYRVGPDWFQAIETYHEDGAMALRRAAKQDPRMMDVLDAWATRRYALDKVNDADSAWAAFQRICEEADATREYFTASVAGRAVELLTPKLPQERLVDRAVQLIRTYRGRLGCAQWTRDNGRYTNFGHNGRGSVDSANNNRLLLALWGDRGSFSCPTSAFAVAHAVWILDQQLLAEDGTQPNPIETRIAPEVLRSQYKSYSWGLPMQAAVAIGGPEVDQFLLRQRWAANPEQLDWSEQTHTGSVTGNLWLYCLAHLNDDAGRQFHREHASLFMQLADGCVGEDINNGQLGEIGFIFSDPWLAEQYWPHFMRRAAQKSDFRPLHLLWQYLVYAGDAATPSMFVDAWVNAKTKYFCDVPCDLLDQVKPEIRRQAVDALTKRIQEHPDDLRELMAANHLDAGECARQVLDQLYEHATKRQCADWLFRKLQKGVPASQEYSVRNVSLWLAYTQPDSPLVGKLVNADKPGLRQMALDALQESPTPENQRLLGKLCNDPDTRVRIAAQAASQRLKKLAVQSPFNFASNPAARSN